MGGQMFDARTGVLTQMSDGEMQELRDLINGLAVGFPMGPMWITPDKAFLLLVSPH
jgi:hypothetical protein